MKIRVMFLFAAIAALSIAAAVTAADQKKEAAPAGEWSMDATVIEACSCPMFCQCYFGGGEPAGHHDMNNMGTEQHYCRFNNVFRVNHGVYKGVKLDGAKFWVGGDLGGDFTKGQMDWAMVVFDKSVTPQQREGIATIAGHIYPVKWNSFTTGEGNIEWTADKSGAHASLDGGQGGEVKLENPAFGEHGQTPVIRGLKYWGVDHNDGFVLMPNSVETFKMGDKPFEFKGTNGFMITVHIADHAAQPAGGKSGF